VISGASLTLSCTAYTNDSAPTGITTSSPVGSPIAPTIAQASGTPGSTSTTAPPTTTTLGGANSTLGPESTPPSSSPIANASAATLRVGSSLVAARSGVLAFTGGGAFGWIGCTGAVLVLSGLVLLGITEAPRNVIRVLATSVAKQKRSRGGAETRYPS
jgi:hypothetical protein